MEVEVKVKLDGQDLEAVKKKLIERGAVFNGPIVQKDKYFKPNGIEEKVQSPGDFIVRIRRVGEKSILTSKVLTEVRGAWIENEIEIVAFVLDLINHKGYDRKFGYKKK